MRLYSTPQSALAGEVTVLAIIETIAATAFSVWLVVHRGTLTHVVIGACVAPFLLLRTDESTTLAIKWADKLRHLSISLFKQIEAIGGGFAHFTLMLISIPLVRPASLAFTAILHPVSSIKAIPQNWKRIILATDFFHPPEILPEAETRNSQVLSSVPVFRFSQVIQLIGREYSLKRDSAEWIGRIIAALLVGTFWFIPGLAYRYALKATAIVYLPILWVLHDSLVEATSFQHKLEDVQHSQIERLKRWYSGFVLLFLVLIPFLIYVIKQEWWHEISIRLEHAGPAASALLSAFLPTTPAGLQIRGWHLARGINAILTIALFIWADGKLRQIARGTFQKADAAVAQLNLGLLVRGILTLYIIGCTIYIAAAAVNWKTLWPIHIKWVPWS